MTSSFAGAEQERCNSLLLLLLPPTIAAEVKSKTSARDLLEHGLLDEAGGPGASTHGPALSSLGGERYAESFAEASVLFAESACGHRHFLPPPPLASLPAHSECVIRDSAAGRLWGTAVPSAILQGHRPLYPPPPFPPLASWRLYPPVSIVLP